MLTTFITPYLDTLIQHPKLIQLIIYWIFFFASFIGIGAIIPGALLLVMLGTLISAKKLHLVTTVLTCMIGSITSSLLSFWIGYHYQERLKETYLFRTYPVLLSQGETFFKHFGKISILIGKFTGPTRAVLPIIAGITGMNPYHFILFDTCATILWPLVYILPSTYFVQYSTKLTAFFHLHSLILLALIIIILNAMRQYLKPFSQFYIQPFLKVHTKFQQDIQLYQSKPYRYSLLIIFLLSAIFLGLLAFDVKAQGITTLWNSPLNKYLHSQRLPQWDKFFTALALISAKTIGYAWLAITVWLIWKKDLWRALHWALLGISVYSTTGILKSGLSIARPNLILKPSRKGSFPSGHMTNNVSMIYGFMLICGLKYDKIWIKFLVYGIYGIWIAFMAFSRLYLGAHWLTDVIGAILVSVNHIALFNFSYSRYQKPLPDRKSLILVALVTLALGWSLRFITQYEKLLFYHIPL